MRRGHCRVGDSDWAGRRYGAGPWLLCADESRVHRKLPSADIDGALESVVQNWIETWSSSLAEAGVPSNRIYSHIAFAPDAHGSANGSYARYTPPQVAFEETHRAG